jgi:predicted nucleotidyltransferase
MLGVEQRLSQNFGPVVKVDLVTKETIRYDEEKDTFT